MTIYQGSYILKPLADAVGLPVDQLNFVTGQLLALMFAHVFRTQLTANKVPAAYRHCISTLVGLALSVFCYGAQLGHILAQVLGCYLLMLVMPGSVMHIAVFVYAMGYLSYIHISSMIASYGSYVLDVSSCMMVTSQKLTSLGFSLHDGIYKKESELKHDQAKHAVRKFPNLLVFLSYLLNFHGIVVGPLCFYNDYNKFMEGNDFPGIDEAGGNEYSRKEKRPNKAVLNKVFTAAFHILAAMTLAKIFTIEQNADKAFVEEYHFVLRIAYLLIAVFLSRAKYYFAWKLAEAVNNAAGFGFSGYSSDGEQQWDLITNVRIINIETSSSFKGIVDNWNIQTAVWLKRICYERAPVARTILTYSLSAMWHGFYPGYYITFVSAAFVTLAARAVRRNIRPYFLPYPILKVGYDVFTWFCAQLTLAYLIVPHVLMDFEASWYFYGRSMYFTVHIFLASILLGLPYSKRSKPTPTPSKEELVQTIGEHSTETMMPLDEEKENIPPLLQQKMK